MKKARNKNKMDTQESLDFIIDNMASKSDVRDIVRKEVENILDEKQMATKDDIKGIVSTVHNRIDREADERKKLEVPFTKLERKVLS